MKLVKRIGAYFASIENPWEHHVLKWIPTAISIVGLIIAAIVIVIAMQRG